VQTALLICALPRGNAFTTAVLLLLAFVHTYDAEADDELEFILKQTQTSLLMFQFT